MPRRRLNWTYDDDKQQFTTPTGRVITLHEIAGLIRIVRNVASTWKALGLAGAYVALR